MKLKILFMLATMLNSINDVRGLKYALLQFGFLHNQAISNDTALKENMNSKSADIQSHDSPLFHNWFFDKFHL